MLLFHRKALERRIDRHGMQMFNALQDLARAAGKPADEALPLVRKVIAEATALQRDLPASIPHWRALGEIVAGGTAVLDGDVAAGMARIDAGYVALEAEGKR